MEPSKTNLRRGRSLSDRVVLYLGLLALVAIAIALILPAMQAERGSIRSESLNRVRTVGLATHNFMSGNDGQFPPILPGETMGSFSNNQPDRTVKEPISFLASLLTLLERPKLYSKIDSSVSWTHPNNRAAYSTRVETFEWPEDTRPYFENEKTAAGYAVTYISPNSRIISTPGNPITIQEIADADGTTMTVMLGTIDDSNVPAWGDPKNARDPANGFAGGPDAYGGLEYGANVVMADGSAKSLSKNIDPKVAKALATPAGGESIPAR